MRLSDWQEKKIKEGLKKGEELRKELKGEKEIGAIISEKYEWKTLRVKLSGKEERIWGILKKVAKKKGYGDTSSGTLMMLMYAGCLLFGKDMLEVVEEEYKEDKKIIEELMKEKKETPHEE